MNILVFYLFAEYNLGLTLISIHCLSTQNFIFQLPFLVTKLHETSSSQIYSVAHFVQGL